MAALIRRLTIKCAFTPQGAATVALTPEGQVVGYLSLSCDAVKLTDLERSGFDARKRYGEYPALKIGRMAVHKNHHSQGVGRALIQYAVGMGWQLKLKTGCRFLTVDAYPNANPFYEKLGFTDNLSKNKPGRQTISKRYDLLNPKK